MRISKLLPVALLLFFCCRGGSQIGAQAAPPAKPEASASNVENGKKVFARARCNACHGDQAQGTNIGPQLAPPGLDLPAMMRYVRQPVGNMPPVSARAVSDQELTDVYAFLKSIAPGKPVELLTGDAQKGKQLFTTFGCYECHGTQGQGPVIGSRIGPPAISQSAFTQYVHHPSGQMPPYTEKVVSGQNLADIYAFLKSIPPPAPAASIPLLNQ
jgi:mono/diheme cytochrome c family protein